MVSKIKAGSYDTSTYAKDQDASHNGGVLRRSDFIVCGAEEALLGAIGAGHNDALLGSHYAKNI